MINRLLRENWDKIFRLSAQATEVFFVTLSKMPSSQVGLTVASFFAQSVAYVGTPIIEYNRNLSLLDDNVGKNLSLRDKVGDQLENIQEKNTETFHLLNDKFKLLEAEVEPIQIFGMLNKAYYLYYISLMTFILGAISLEASKLFRDGDNNTQGWQYGKIGTVTFGMALSVGNAIYFSSQSNILSQNTNKLKALANMILTHDKRLGVLEVLSNLRDSVEDVKNNNSLDFERSVIHVLEDKRQNIRKKFSQKIKSINSKVERFELELLREENEYRVELSNIEKRLDYHNNEKNVEDAEKTKEQLEVFKEDYQISQSETNNILEQHKDSIIQLKQKESTKIDEINKIELVDIEMLINQIQSSSESYGSI